MQVDFFCPRWGSEQLAWAAFFEKVKAAGYDGVEYAIPAATTAQELETVWALADKTNLQLIAQHYDTADTDYNRHFDLYAAWLEKMKAFPCVKLNSQTGRDCFNMEENMGLIQLAAAFEIDTGMPVVHETHRGKFSFAAHVTYAYLQCLPGLRLTLDASHWVNVAESYLEDQSLFVEAALQRADHVHARVGHPQGPQVPDPRAPEWKHAVDIHCAWWKQVGQLREAAGTPTLTITPEFGPVPYLSQVPFTREPVADQWEVNLFMMQLLRKKMAAYTAV